MRSHWHLALHVLALAAVASTAASASTPPQAVQAALPPPAVRPPTELGEQPPLETFHGSLHLWRGGRHSAPSATVVVDRPSQLFLVLSNLPELGPPFPAGWGNEAHVTVTGTRVAGSGLNWMLEVAPGGLEITSPAPRRLPPLDALWQRHAQSQQGGVSAAASPKPGLRVLYIRARFPDNCRLAPGQRRASAASVAAATRMLREAGQQLSACSFGRVGIDLARSAVTLLLPMTCPEAHMDPCSPGTMTGWAAILTRRAAARGYRLADYDVVNVEFPDTPTPGRDRDPTCPLSYGSRAQLGGNTIFDNYKEVQPSHIFLHEFLHTLGIDHANGWASSYLPSGEGQDNYLDYYSIMGWSFVLSCPGYPHMAQLLPGAFKPTALQAAKLSPGSVSTWKVAPDWSRPAAGGGLHAALRIDVAPLLGASAAGKSVWVSYFTQAGPQRLVGTVNGNVGKRQVLLRYTYKDAVATWFLTQLDAGQAAAIVLAPQPNACEDMDASCAAWAATGECSNNPGYMLQNCRRSCGVCSGPVEPCEDQNTSCSYWASNGECSKNPAYMLQSCKLSCGACSTAPTCVDDNSQCGYWASVGECAKNPAYMLVSCKRSCNACQQRKARQLMAVRGAQPLPNSLQVRLLSASSAQATVQFCFARDGSECGLL